MTRATRSGRLLLLLPGLVLGTVYIYLGKPRVEREAAEARRDVEELRGQAPAPGAEGRAAERERVLQEEIRGLEAAREREASQGPAAVEGAGERLAALLSGHGLLLLEERIDPREETGALPPGFAADSGRLRLLTVQGRYLDVLAVLRLLPEAKIGAVPLRLVRSRIDDQVHWRLLLWM